MHLHNGVALTVLLDTLQEATVHTFFEQQFNDVGNIPGGLILLPECQNPVQGIVFCVQPPSPETVHQALARGVSVCQHPDLNLVERKALNLLFQASLPSYGVCAFLLAATHSIKPERDLVERVFAVTGVGCAFYSAWGEVLAGSGSRHWSPEPPKGGEFVGFKIRGGHEFVLQKALPETVVNICLAVLDVAEEKRLARVAKEQAQTEALLTEILTASPGHHLEERLFAKSLKGEYAIAQCEWVRAVRQKGRVREELERIRQAGDNYLTRLGVPFLSAIRGNGVVWLWCTSKEKTHAKNIFASALASSTQDIRLGVSDLQQDWSRAAHALRQAHLSLRSTRDERSMSYFSAVDPLQWVAFQQPPENIRVLAESVKLPLLQADPSGKLLETVKAYLQSPENLAERLHIHSNTLRYRMGKIESILGQSLGHPATLVRLYLALYQDMV